MTLVFATLIYYTSISYLYLPGIAFQMNIFNIIINYILYSILPLYSPNYASASPIKTLYLAQLQNSVKSMTPEASLERLFTSEDVKAEWFAAEFLAQVTINQINTIINDVKNQLGIYPGVEKDGNDYVVNFSQGSVPTKIALNNQGQIIGLLLQPSLTISSLSEALAEVKKYR